MTIAQMSHFYALCPPQAYPIFHYIAAIETGACASICPYGGGDG